MTEVAAALIAGAAVAAAVLALGGAPFRLPAREGRAHVVLRRFAAGEARRAQAAGLGLGAPGLIVLELLLTAGAVAVGYLLTGMPVLALAAGGLGWGLFVTPPLIHAVRTCKTFPFSLFSFSPTQPYTPMPYCVASLILAAVCSADCSNVLSV